LAYNLRAKAPFLRLTLRHAEAVPLAELKTRNVSGLQPLLGLTVAFLGLRPRLV
jgi:hypothetical protein